MLHTTHLLEEAVVAQRLVALERGSLVYDGSPHSFFQEKQLLEELGLEVPAIAQLDEMLSSSGITDPGEVASLEKLLELLTVLETQKDNETVEI